MKEIVKTLLMEGIDEETIHKVLDVIEEEYEVIDEGEHLEGVVYRAKRAGKISPEKADELTKKAMIVKGTNDFNIDPKTGEYSFSGRRGILGGPIGDKNKDYRKSMSKHVEKLLDPKRVERIQELGKIINPSSIDHEASGANAFNQIRQNRKAEKVKNREKQN